MQIQQRQYNLNKINSLVDCLAHYQTDEGLRLVTNKFGMQPAKNIIDLENKLAIAVKKYGESALEEICNVHPHKNLIIYFYEKEKEKQKDIDDVINYIKEHKEIQRLNSNAVGELNKENKKEFSISPLPKNTFEERKVVEEPKKPIDDKSIQKEPCAIKKFLSSYGLATAIVGACAISLGLYLITTKRVRLN